MTNISRVIVYLFLILGLVFATPTSILGTEDVFETIAIRMQGCLYVLIGIGIGVIKLMRE